MTRNKQFSRSLQKSSICNTFTFKRHKIQSKETEEYLEMHLICIDMTAFKAILLAITELQ